MEENRQVRACDHVSPAERGWHACLTSPDVEFALERGYQIPRVYQIADWGALDKRDDLFKGVITVITVLYNKVMTFICGLV